MEGRGRGHPPLAKAGGYEPQAYKSDMSQEAWPTKEQADVSTRPLMRRLAGQTGMAGAVATIGRVDMQAAGHDASDSGKNKKVTKTQPSKIL